MTKYYTMIGSRNTPRDVMDILSNLAEDLATLGLVGRSGGAVGADQAMENGLFDYHLRELMEIYLPWDGFRGKSSEYDEYINTPGLNNYRKAKRIAKDIHPAWGNCKEAARKFHTRNVYQILGKDLDTPSEFVICYAEPTGTDGYVKGGTATAVKIAIDRGIPVINLAVPGWEDKMIGIMEKM